MSPNHMNWIKKILLVNALGCISFASIAEITLLKQDPQAGNPFSRLDFKVGASIRPQIMNTMGESDRGSYKNNGYDGGTRFRFSADYFLFDDISLISHYELGVDIPRLFKWNNHYQKDTSMTTRRKLFVGLKSETYGQLTYGKQDSIYYTTVGIKTDLWDNDMKAQASGNGINGDYDGSQRGRKLIQYKKTIGDADIYLGGILADDDYTAGSQLRYKRKGGMALGIDYHLTDTLSWAISYSYIKAKIKDTGAADPGSNNYKQQLLGTGLSWNPGDWIFATTVGWYHDFLMSTKKIRENYFADNAYGVEYFAGYKIPVEKYVIKSITPFFAGDRLKYKSGRNYQSNHQFIGIQTQFDYGLRIDLEHTFSNTSDNQGGANLVRLYYDF